MVNSGFDGRRIAAWRDGLRQFYASDEGIEHNDDTLWVHPPFVADERWIVEVTDTNRWDTLALSDTANSLLTGIVAYWMCEESSGNVVDTVGNNDGTVNNGVAYQATGVVGYAWEFDGGTDSVLISNTGDLELQEFSVSLWFQTNYYYPFFTNWDSGNGWYIELNGNTKTRFQINGKDFVNKDVYFPVGLYSIPRKGRSSVGFTSPPLATELLPVLDETNILNPNDLRAERSISKNFYNATVWRFNQDSLSDKFLAGEIFLSEKSVARIESGTTSILFV